MQGHWPYGEELPQGQAELLLQLRETRTFLPRVPRTAPAGQLPQGGRRPGPKGRRRQRAQRGRRQEVLQLQPIRPHGPRLHREGGEAKGQVLQLRQVRALLPRVPLRRPQEQQRVLQLPRSRPPRPRLPQQTMSDVHTPPTQNIYILITMFNLIKITCGVAQSVHPYLQQGLRRNGMLPLRPCQETALRIFEEGKQVMINQLDGSGKTLAYLLPVINRILHSKKTSPPKSGAIILTLNKQLALQIYRLIRLLDFDNILSVCRSGSITHYSPVIDEMCKKKEEQDEDLILDLMDINVAKAVQWPHTDILISTPQLLYKILAEKESNKETVSPEMIVVDEADLILRKEELSNYFRKDYQYINQLSAKEGTRRYILCSASRNFLKDDKKSGMLSQHFESTKYSNPNSILQSLKIKHVRINTQATAQEIFSERITALISLMGKRQGKKVVIYCSGKAIQPIRLALKSKLDLGCVEYYAKMSSQKRMAALFDFNFGTANILVTTELANRGLSFLQPVDTIISLQPCVSEVEEAVRMCRSNKEGAQYIVMTDFSDGLLKLQSDERIGKYLQNASTREICFVNNEEVER